MGGKAYLSASNPRTTNNTNPAPAVVAATLAGNTVHTTTVLLGNAKATDANAGNQVAIAAIDPDSMFINPQGNLTLDNQAGTALITIHNPGPSQTVTQLTVGTQIDDTVYPTATGGRLLVADTKGETIYAITGLIGPTTPIVAAPDDSAVHGFVGKLETSGNIVPIIVGFNSPHGMAYMPATDNSRAIPLLLRHGLPSSVRAAPAGSRVPTAVIAVYKPAADQPRWTARSYKSVQQVALHK